MTWFSPPTVATGEIFTAAMWNTYIRDNPEHLRALLGNGDPGAASRTLVSANSVTGAWQSYVDSTVFTNYKANAFSNRTTGTFASITGANSGGMWLVIGAPDGPIPGNTYWCLNFVDNAFPSVQGAQLAIPFSNSAVIDLAVRTFVGGVSSIWSRIWNQQNDGTGSGLDAGSLQGFVVGNSASQVPVSNGFTVANLVADLLDGYHAGNAANQIPISNLALCANLWADILDGYHAGNGNTQIPINNGALNAGLNADMVDGYHEFQLAKLSGVQAFTNLATFAGAQGAVIQSGAYGGNDTPHNKATGFTPRFVLIVARSSSSIYFVTNTTAAFRLSAGAPMYVSAVKLAVNGFTVGGAGTEANTSGTVYDWVALG